MDNNTELRTLDLFSGIGGISVGLQRWCKTVCYVELDSYAQAALCKNMAGGHLDIAPIWDDVTTFGKDELEAIGPVDCITGGFPCQDISCAGKGEGIRGERSGLFFEIIRLIRLARPRYIFLENVPALLARWMDTVLAELSESGYDARWKVLSAAEVGAPHRRDRWWCLGHTNRTRQLQPQGVQQDERGRAGNTGQDVADTISIRQQGPGQFGVWCGKKAARKGETDNVVPVSLGHNWSVEPDVGRVAHGIPFRVDRLKCLGNSVVPQCCEKAFEILLKEL